MSGSPKAIDGKDLERVSGGTFTDHRGTEANDVIVLGNGMDRVFAGGGSDIVSTGGGQDEVHAGSGNDHVNTGAGNDRAYGGEGNDYIFGGAGSDELFGDAGNDTLDGGGGDGAADRAFGGDGNDTFLWGPGDGNDEFHGGDGQDTLRLVGVNLHTLEAALQLQDPSLQMHVSSAGEVTFLNHVGDQVTFSGELRIGGETLKFINIERIVLTF